MGRGAKLPRPFTRNRTRPRLRNTWPWQRTCSASRTKGRSPVCSIHDPLQQPWDIRRGLAKQSSWASLGSPRIHTRVLSWVANTPQGLSHWVTCSHVAIGMGTLAHTGTQPHHAGLLELVLENRHVALSRVLAVRLPEARPNLSGKSLEMREMRQPDASWPGRTHGTGTVRTRF